MGVTPYQYSIGTGTGTLGTVLATVPAGCVGVTMFVPGTSTVYIGSGTNLSTTNGYPVVGGAAPTSFPVAPEAKTATVLYALASAVNTPIGLIISTAG